MWTKEHCKQKDHELPQVTLDTFNILPEVSISNSLQMYFI